nr:hypothetical protein MFLOJ_35640 [Mycobacterium florentinum]
MASVNATVIRKIRCTAGRSIRQPGFVTALSRSRACVHLKLFGRGDNAFPATLATGGPSKFASG